MKRNRQETREKAIRQAHLRHLDFYAPTHHNPRVTIVGAGGIGSQVAVSLAKLGVHQMAALDFDRVEVHNVATTPYTKRDVGKPKVEALRTIVERASPTPSQMVFKPLKKRFTPKTRLPKTNILISAVDSGAVRLELFEMAKTLGIECFIDGRIGGENIRVYTINMRMGDEIEHYPTTVPRPGTESPLPCTGAQVVDVGWMIASLITRAFRNWVARGIYNYEIVHNQATMETLVTETVLRETGQAVQATESGLEPERGPEPGVEQSNNGPPPTSDQPSEIIIPTPDIGGGFAAPLPTPIPWTPDTKEVEAV